MRTTCSRASPRMNAKIAGKSGPEQSAGLADERDRLISEFSKLVDLRVMRHRQWRRRLHHHRRLCNLFDGPSPVKLSFDGACQARARIRSTAPTTAARRRHHQAGWSQRLHQSTCGRQLHPLRRDRRLRNCATRRWSRRRTSSTSSPPTSPRPCPMRLWPARRRRAAPPAASTSTSPASPAAMP